jgi:hypothetical protein
MYARLLVDEVVRQTAVLLAELVTRSEERALLSEVQTELLLHLDNELRQRGLSQSARIEALGTTRAAYVQAMKHGRISVTEPSCSLSEAIFRIVTEHGLASREQLAAHFAQDDEERVSGAIERLVGSGLLFRAGRQGAEVLRAPSASDLSQACYLDAETGLDQLVRAVIYREGPLSFAELTQRLNAGEAKLHACLERLGEQRQVSKVNDGNVTRYGAREFSVPLESPTGMEASVLDHLQAVTRALLHRLQLDVTRISDENGVSTYTLDVWESHPYSAEARGLLREFRERVSNLRKRIEAYNAASKASRALRPVRIYFGQRVA